MDGVSNESNDQLDTIDMSISTIALLLCCSIAIPQPSLALTLASADLPSPPQTSGFRGQEIYQQAQKIINEHSMCSYYMTSTANPVCL